MKNPAPYVENYVNVWCGYGFTFECLKKLSKYLFRQEKNSFEEMNGFIRKLYDSGIIADRSVDDYIEKRQAEDKLIREILTACGLTRKIVPWDRENLSKWRSWNFSDEMLLEAAKLSSGKSNPMAYIGGILSGWKTDGIYSKDKITPTASRQISSSDQKSEGSLRSNIERHYYDLRHAAEERAETAFGRAMSDSIYSELRKELNSLSIELAFAEIRDKTKAEQLSERITKLENEADGRLAILGLNKSEFIPRYSCEICSDTGYDKSGVPCVCLKQYLNSIK